MVDLHIHGCPEPEVLAAYVDRGLSLAERGRVDIHLASCPQCIALVAGVARTVAEVSAHLPDAVVAAEATPLLTRRFLAGAVAAAAAVIAVVAGPSVVGPWLHRDAGLVSLVDSVGEHRLVLGRLTGGFPHAPLGVPSAGGQDGRTAGTDRVLLTAGKIRESFGERQTPSQLHALGVSQLLAGGYDDAAQLLLAASREQPANAQYLNDVATVQLERARRGLRPDDLPRALASADRARRLDPSLKEAWFNRALAVSSLSLAGEARSAWSEYLKRDGTSAWAAEARSRLEELSRPTPASAWIALEGRLQQTIDANTAEQAVRTQMTEARAFIENHLFPAWATAVIDGQDASLALDRLRLMAEAMQRVGGDALYRDAVAAIDRTHARGPAALQELAAAHRSYAEAVAIFMQDRFADAAPKLIAARARLESAGSPFAHRVSIDIAGTTLVRADYAPTLTAIEAVKAAAQGNGYQYLQARAFWFEGLVAFAQGRLGDTQAHYEDTLSTFERMGDVEQVAIAHNLIAALYYYLGDKSHEWEHRQPALSGLSISRSVRLRSNLLATAGISLRADNPEAALLLHDAALAAARDSGRGIITLEILTQRAATLLALGRSTEAAADVRAARRELAMVREPRLKEVYELMVLAPEGELQRQQDSRAAASSAKRALEIIRTRNNPADRSRLPAFQLQLAKANIVWGHRIEEAKVALTDGIKAFEAERSLIADEGRISSLDQSWQLFEVAVQLAIEEKDYPKAFEMAERARVRTIGEAKRSPAPPSLDAVQATLQDGDAILALNQFNAELAIWVIRRGSVSVTKRALARVDAVRLIARQQDEIWEGAARPAAGGILYNEIVRPVASQLRGASRIVFVPDTTYQDTAFAGLWDSARQRFLVEDWALSLAPSVDTYVRAVARGSSNAGTPLILGGPSPAADADARAVAAVYPMSSVLTGPSATRNRFLADAPSHSIVHLSTHTATNRAFPLLSRILLADEAGQRHSGALLGSEIAARSMSQTNLVVIDEVETSATDRGEGTLSLARAFLTAGVPAVLGTLPGANEQATRDLMIGFHREMSKNISAEQALSTVQRNAIQQNGRRLGAWSALVLYGSDR